LTGVSRRILIREELTLEFERKAGIRKSEAPFDQLRIEEGSVRQVQIHQLPVVRIGSLFAESYGDFSPVEVLPCEFSRFTSEVLDRVIGSNAFRSIDTNQANPPQLSEYYGVSVYDSRHLILDSRPPKTGGTRDAK
jgi:hypothetical protein